MKKAIKKLLFGMVAIMLAVSLTSCESDNNGGGEGNDALYQSILNNYVSSTIMPTYKSLAEAALEMRAANEALKANPSDATMLAASNAWMKARVAWEISEAFLFGPIGENGLDIDGHIDDWPLELIDIQQEIDKGTITGFEAWTKEGKVIGFHVTEYLLYRGGGSRNFNELTPNEYNYLVAATDALVWDCIMAYVAWAGIDNVSAEMKEVFEQNDDVVAHLNANSSYKNFAAKFKSGAANNGSLAAAVAEIAGGAADIADEVGTTKIESPYLTHRVEEVESWYSWHSLDDYQNNIHSIKNAYLGGMDDNTRTSVSLSTYVAMKNPALDAAVKAKIQDCLTKIKAIGTGGKSFYEVVRDQINPEQVDAAVDACNELKVLFKQVEDIIE